MNSEVGVHEKRSLRDTVIGCVFVIVWVLTAVGCFSRIHILVEDRHHPLASPLVAMKVTIMVLLGLWAAGCAALGQLGLFAPAEEWRLVPEFVFNVVIVQFVRPAAVVLFCVVVSTPAAAPSSTSVTVEQAAPRNNNSNSRVERQIKESSRGMGSRRSKKKEMVEMVKNVEVTHSNDRFHIPYLQQREGISNFDNDFVRDEDMYSALGEVEDVRSNPRQNNSRERGNGGKFYNKQSPNMLNVGNGYTVTRNNSTPGKGIPQPLFGATVPESYSVLDSECRSNCQAALEWDEGLTGRDFLGGREMYNNSYSNAYDVATIPKANWEGEHDVSRSYSSGSCASSGFGGSGSGYMDAEGIGTTIVVAAPAAAAATTTTPTPFLGGSSASNSTRTNRSSRDRGRCMSCVSSLIHWIIGRIPSDDAAYTDSNAMTRWSRLFGWRVALRLRLFIPFVFLFVVLSIYCVISAARGDVVHCIERLSEMSVCKMPGIQSISDRLYLPRTLTILATVSNSLLLLVWTVSGVECLGRIGNVLTKQSFLRTFFIGALLLSSLTMYEVLQLFDELRYNGLLTLVIRILKNICENVLVILLMLRLGSGSGKMPRWYSLVGSVLYAD
ncbi:uncharacterized protein TM35_000312030 [Trypanosoma theileri]|uniref:Uncharacterized protein n=1 Tax=Trypanosoma theileri TaxID=67003 RepID=A0A1X0NMU8_9TRYP|nr:uncharacterized protein TM35_000312030 [Trypanosoma theileri]ORC86017.1 hypothetical protein TM35_000312030 [Trypanosoma theileri]